MVRPLVCVIDDISILGWDEFAETGWKWGGLYSIMTDNSEIKFVIKFQIKCKNWIQNLGHLNVIVRRFNPINFQIYWTEREVYGNLWEHGAD